MENQKILLKNLKGGEFSKDEIYQLNIIMNELDDTSDSVEIRIGNLISFFTILLQEPTISPEMKEFFHILQPLTKYKTQNSIDLMLELIKTKLQEIHDKTSLPQHGDVSSEYTRTITSQEELIKLISNKNKYVIKDKLFKILLDNYENDKANLVKNISIVGSTCINGKNCSELEPKEPNYVDSIKKIGAINLYNIRIPDKPPISIWYKYNTDRDFDDESLTPIDYMAFREFINFGAGTRPKEDENAKDNICTLDLLFERNDLMKYILLKNSKNKLIPYIRKCTPSGTSGVYMCDFIMKKIPAAYGPRLNINISPVGDTDKMYILDIKKLKDNNILDESNELNKDKEITFQIKTNKEESKPTIYYINKELNTYLHCYGIGQDIQNIILLNVIYNRKKKKINCLLKYKKSELTILENDKEYCKLHKQLVCSDSSNNGNLVHPNLLKIYLYQYYIDTNFIYKRYLFEFYEDYREIEGRFVFEKNSLKIPNWKTYKELSFKLLEVVKYIQDKNCIHTDIAPQNILIKADYTDLILIDIDDIDTNGKKTRNLTPTSGGVYGVTEHFQNGILWYMSYDTAAVCYFIITHLLWNTTGYFNIGNNTLAVLTNTIFNKDILHLYPDMFNITIEELSKYYISLKTYITQQLDIYLDDSFSKVYEGVQFEKGNLCENIINSLTSPEVGTI